MEGWGENPVTADPSYCGIRAQDFMYTSYKGGAQELYDLRTDPGELRNLARNPAYRVQLRTLHARMLHACRPPPPGFHPR
jgi:hypothetical protein